MIGKQCSSNISKYILISTMLCIRIFDKQICMFYAPLVMTSIVCLHRSITKIFLNFLNSKATLKPRLVSYTAVDIKIFARHVYYDQSFKVTSKNYPFVTLIVLIIIIENLLRIVHPSTPTLV